jgi:hypothetical protein
MVKLYTEYLLGDVITDNEAFFDRFISAKSIDNVGRRYLKQIDGADIESDETGLITTPFGATILENISTGAKTVLNLLHLQKNNKVIAIDVTECGANALDAVFELMEGYDGTVKVVLGHAETSKCSSRKYCVNDKHIAYDGIGLSIVLMEAFTNEHL